MKKIITAGIIAMTVALAGCLDTDAKVVSQNLSKAADMFEINRRIVFYNGITDTYMLTIEGRCSIDTNPSGTSFHVTCMTGRNEYKKHFLGLSDNVTYFAEQLESAKASAYHYRVIFKPQVIIPNVDFSGSASAAAELITK